MLSLQRPPHSTEPSHWSRSNADLPYPLFAFLCQKLLGFPQAASPVREGRGNSPGRNCMAGPFSSPQNLDASAMLPEKCQLPNQPLTSQQSCLIFCEEPSFYCYSMQYSHIFPIDFFIYRLCIATITCWWVCCLLSGPSLAQAAEKPVLVWCNRGSSHACSSGWSPLNQAHSTQTFHSGGFYSLCFTGQLAQRRLDHWSELLDVAKIPLPNKGRLWFMQWKQSGWKCLRIQQPVCFKAHPWSP